MNFKKLLYVDTDCVISYSNRLRRNVLFLRNCDNPKRGECGLKKCNLKITGEVDHLDGNKYYLLEAAA